MERGRKTKVNGKEESVNERMREEESEKSRRERTHTKKTIVIVEK